MQNHQFNSIGWYKHCSETMMPSQSAYNEMREWEGRALDLSRITDIHLISCALALQAAADFRRFRMRMGPLDHI